MVNLSTLVALLATIFRSMLENVLSSVIGQLTWRWFRSSPHSLNRIETFTDASRGSWGSLRFMFSSFRPYALQTVPCQKPSLQGNASVPIAQTVASHGALLRAGNGNAMPYFSFSMDPISSLTAGLAGVRSPNSLSPECLSGNCYFQAIDNITYSSLGFNSECVDISPLIKQTGRLYWDTDGASTFPTHTNYSLPHMDLNLSYNLVGDVGSPGVAKFGWSGTADLENTSLTQRQKDIVNASVDSFSFLMITTSPCQDPVQYQDYLAQYAPPMPSVNTSLCPTLNLPGVTTLPGPFSLVAAGCFFYPSVQHYYGSVVNGTFKEHGVGAPVPLHVPQPPNSLPHLSDDELFHNLWSWAFSDPCIVDNMVYTSTSSNLSSVPGGLVTVSNTTAPKRCLYGLNRDWEEQLISFAGLSMSYIISAGLSYDVTCQQSNNYTVMICPEAYWLSGLFNGGNATIASISAFLDTGLKSFTDQLRTHGTDWDHNPLMASGTVMETTVCTEFY
ncbi:zinc-binding oxidoreductase protein [Apiospora saccharicola]|uniref:Zinc-binding oxidoreductase protein n=1 Tax=Apiospora saccharicola TaxID=335842 RepID=A0ABR1VBT0_9PEZI